MKQAIESRIDFAKLMKDKIFDPAELISVEEVRKEVNKDKNILGRRTIEFYARNGLLKKSIRITGDKTAYYHRDYIFDALGLVLLLKAKYGMKLSEISNFMKTIRHSPKNVFTDLMYLEDEFEKRKQRYKPEDDPSYMDSDKDKIGEKYIDLILRNKKKKMLELIEILDEIYKKLDGIEDKFKGVKRMGNSAYDKACNEIIAEFEGL